MQLHGLSKLTLLDFPGHLACTVFTGACNFRCPFCHNAPLVLAPNACPLISEEEFFEFLSSRKGKLDGVCITGGEPTLQPDLPEFIAKIKALGFLVKLDTNGYRPEVLKFLLEQNLLDMVAMDIKNSKEQYAFTCGVPDTFFDITRIEESISLLLTAKVPHEFRTTVTAELHNAEQMTSLGTWLCKLSQKALGTDTLSSPYFLQNFKDSGDLVCSEQLFHPLAEETLQHFLSILKPSIPNITLRGQ